MYEKDTYSLNVGYVQYEVYTQVNRHKVYACMIYKCTCTHSYIYSTHTHMRTFLHFKYTLHIHYIHTYTTF